MCACVCFFIFTTLNWSSRKQTINFDCVGTSSYSSFQHAACWGERSSSIIANHHLKKPCLFIFTFSIRNQSPLRQWTNPRIFEHSKNSKMNGDYGHIRIKISVALYFQVNFITHYRLISVRERWRFKSLYVGTAASHRYLKAFYCDSDNDKINKFIPLQMTPRSAKKNTIVFVDLLNFQLPNQY